MRGPLQSSLSGSPGSAPLLDAGLGGTCLKAPHHRPRAYLSICAPGAGALSGGYAGEAPPAGFFVPCPPLG